MQGVLVSLDLETTGLDIARDAIIEIGAVKLKDGVILEEYTQLINPGFDIPVEITHLTGIHAEDVQSAPVIDQVLGAVSEFIGDAPVVAHNVSFDLGFMQRHGILLGNPSIDTFELASVLLPNLPQYTLGAIASMLKIELASAHRALDDARATALLYWELWQKIGALPLDMLTEISAAASAVKWDTGRLFEAALIQLHPDSPSQYNPENKRAFFNSSSEATPSPSGARASLPALDHVEAIFGPDGLLSEQLESYTHRPQQASLAQSIASALDNNQHLIIEAGTGTGKSLAYAIPAVLKAVNQQERVVIATHSSQMRDQLLNETLPAISGLMHVPISAAAIKGHDHYLCPQKFELMRRRGPANIDEARTLAKILIWLLSGVGTDRDAISLRAGEHAVWKRLSAGGDSCTHQHCEMMTAGLCPLQNARQQAEAADIILVDQQILITDAIAEDPVIPGYRYLIIDEAHQIEASITDSLSTRLRPSILTQQLDRISKADAGVLGALAADVQQNLPPKQAGKIVQFTETIGSAAKDMTRLTERYFVAVERFLSDLQESGHITDYQYQVRILPKHRNYASFAAIQKNWQIMDEYFAGLIDALQYLSSALERFSKLAADDHLRTISSIVSFLQMTQTQLHQFSEEPDANTIYWINLGDAHHEMTLCTAPLHIGPMMEEIIWHAKSAAVLLSTTFRTNQNFEYICDRLYAEQITTLTLDSPFDYAGSILVFLPDDVPNPNQRSQYQHAVETSIIDLATVLGGRVLALFTSYGQLKETARNISPRLRLGSIAVYEQAGESGREALLESFKSTEQAVLLGARSFWEGVHIPGDDLSALVITRLPFNAPSDPVFAARSDTYSNPLKQFALPEAIIRFRQGFDRLMRTSTDRGIVAVIDTRISTKSYGLNFLDALPDCTIRSGPIDQLSVAAERWLKSDR